MDRVEAEQRAIIRMLRKEVRLYQGFLARPSTTEVQRVEWERAIYVLTEAVRAIRWRMPGRANKAA